jgi:Tol biopolymer transport system component
VSEEISDADITRDGRSMAVVRWVGGAFRLEYPIGKPLQQTSGYIGFPRISPDGERVAFFDHPLISDDRGSVAVVGRDAKKRTLTPEWASAAGLAWSPSGNEIWFTAAEHGANLVVRAVTLSGKVRRVLPGPGRLILHDIAPDGRLLLEERNVRRALMCLAPGRKQERDLSWLDYTGLTDMSHDGSLLLIAESGEGGGENYGVYVRKTDGSPAVRLGEGMPNHFSPDEKSVLTLVPGPNPKLVLLPVGAGEPRTLRDFGIRLRGARFFPDGKRLLIGGARPGEPLRLFIGDLEGGKLKTVGPEAIGGPPWLSPDGKLLFVVRGDNRAFLYPLEGGDPRELTAYQPGESATGWSGDGRFLYLFNAFGMPVRVWKLDVGTGRRELWREFAPPDATGSGGAAAAFAISADGKSYAYTYSRSLSELFIVEGTR